MRSSTTADVLQDSEVQRLRVSAEQVRAVVNAYRRMQVNNLLRGRPR